jgi:hypothetical protein
MNRHTMTNADTKDKAAPVAAQGANVAPEKTPSKKGTSQRKGAPKAQKSAKAAALKQGAKASKEAAKTERAAAGPRAESKGAKVLKMLGHTNGATLAAIMKATDWQAHSVRGFLSTAAKKHKIDIESSKNEAGDRVYKIAK